MDHCLFRDGMTQYAIDCNESLDHFEGNYEKKETVCHGIANKFLAVQLNIAKAIKAPAGS
jgi:hypothetical protein